MIKNRLYLLAQIVSVMEEAIVKLEESYNNKNAEELEKAKNTILEFQKRLAEELGRRK